MTSWKDLPGWTCPRIVELYDEMARELEQGIGALLVFLAYATFHESSVSCSL